MLLKHITTIHGVRGANELPPETFARLCCVCTHASEGLLGLKPPRKARHYTACNVGISDRGRKLMRFQWKLMPRQLKSERSPLGPRRMHARSSAWLCERANSFTHRDLRFYAPASSEDDQRRRNDAFECLLALNLRLISQPSQRRVSSQHN